MTDKRWVAKIQHTCFVSQPPCCLEFCPSFPQFFIVGTYSLQETQEVNDIQTRNGSLVICEVEDCRAIRQVQTVSTPSAVLDLHFSSLHSSGFDRLGVVTSTGSFEVYDISPGSQTNANQGSLNIKHVLSVQLFAASTLITSFVWDRRDADFIFCTTTEGEVSRCNIKAPEEAQLQVHEEKYPDAVATDRVEALPGHELQAWIIALQHSTSGEDAVLSGGDDAALKYFPYFSNKSEPTVQSWSDRRTHGAGVTAITLVAEALSYTGIPELERLVLTGSYDDKIRLVKLAASDSRLKRPEVLAEKDLGGGGWRIAPIDVRRRTDPTGQPLDQLLLLVSCMYAGVCLVRLTLTHSGVDPNHGTQSWNFEEICWFKEHESICYASAVVPSTARSSDTPEKKEAHEREFTFISTSFYDKRICLWSVKI